MTLTVLGDEEVLVDARIDGTGGHARPWLTPAAFTAATGWRHESEGLCRGAVCVPLRQPVTAGDGTIDLAAAVRALGKQLVFDPAGPVVAIADDPMGRREASGLHELTLPDADGRMVDLSGLAGKKVVLIAWASW